MDSESAADITNVAWKNDDGGIVKEIIKEGTGSCPGNGDEVEVHYVGTLMDGTQFDSSRDRNEHFKFKLGDGQVIKGWDEGVATMKIGERSKFTIKPKYAYGSSGSPPTIPPDSTLRFDVELLGVKGEDISEEKDGSIEKSVLEKGPGYETPKFGGKVDVVLKGVIGDKTFDERSLTFEIGEGSDFDIPTGLETAIKKMKRKEKASISIKSCRGFGSLGSKSLGVPPNTDLVYEVSLNNIENLKDSWELDEAERLQYAETYKTKGTNNFKAGKFEQAEQYYSKAVDCIQEPMADDTDEKKTQGHDLRLSIHLNLAQTYLNLHKESKAIEECDKAIGIDGNSVKAYFRKGMAYMCTKDFQDATRAFDKCLVLDPVNKAAKSKLLTCRKYIQLEARQTKNLYSKMMKGIGGDPRYDVRTNEDAQIEEKNDEDDVKTPTGLPEDNANSMEV